METLATVCFVLAGLHVFAVKRFAHWAHQYPPGSVREKLLRFLVETEVVLGLWAAALFLGSAVLRGPVAHAVAYVEGLYFTESKVVLVLMIVAAMRPGVRWAGDAHRLCRAAAVGPPSRGDLGTG